MPKQRTPIHLLNMTSAYNNKVIIIFNKDIDTRQNGTIYYRTSEEKLLLEDISKDIRRKYQKVKFTAAFAILITYVNMTFGNQKVATAQLVIATDNKTSYAIWNYLSSNEGVLKNLDMGYLERLCDGTRMKFHSAVFHEDVYGVYTTKFRFFMPLTSSKCKDKQGGKLLHFLIGLL